MNNEYYYVNKGKVYSSANKNTISAKDLANKLNCLIELLKEARCSIDAVYCEEKTVGRDGELATKIDKELAINYKKCCGKGYV